MRGRCNLAAAPQHHRVMAATRRLPAKGGARGRSHVAHGPEPHRWNMLEGCEVKARDGAEPDDPEAHRGHHRGHHRAPTAGGSVSASMDATAPKSSYTAPVSGTPSRRCFSARVASCQPG